jgi:hypothetical protein
MVRKIKPPGTGIAIKGVGKASDLLSQTPLDLLTQKMERDRILLEIQDTRLKNMKKEIKKTE